MRNLHFSFVLFVASVHWFFLRDHHVPCKIEYSVDVVQCVRHHRKAFHVSDDLVLLSSVSVDVVEYVHDVLVRNEVVEMDDGGEEMVCENDDDDGMGMDYHVDDDDDDEEEVIEIENGNDVVFCVKMMIACISKKVRYQY